MAELRRHLVVMDIPGIKEYVFGTEPLVEIRGASALLDDLNRAGTKRLLEEALGTENVDCVFSNGGAGQFVIHADEVRLREGLRALKGHVDAVSRGGLRLVCGVSEFDGQGYPAALQRAHLDLKAEKEACPLRPVSGLHTGFVKECDSCSGMASRRVEYAGTTRVLCAACSEKVRAGRERGLWQGLLEHLQSSGLDAEEVRKARPKDFEQIGEMCRTRRGYTALVYADGNAMGRIIKCIEAPEQFRFFSETVDAAVRRACYEALSLFLRDDMLKIPADILLLGGDDLMVYLSADVAVPFALHVARTFEAETRERFASHPFFSRLLEGEGLTLSLGVAFGKSHTPFSILLEQAEELLASAKRAGAADPAAGEYHVPSYLDFHCAFRFNQIRVSECRTHHMEIRDPVPLRLHCRPYSLKDLEALSEHARRLLGSGLPRSRLKRLGWAPSLGKVNGNLECLKAYGRAGDKQRPVIKEALSHFGCMGDEMPWARCPEGERALFRTVLVDLVELAEFTAREK